MYRMKRWVIIEKWVGAAAHLAIHDYETNEFEWNRYRTRRAALKALRALTPRRTVQYYLRKDQS